MLSISIGAPTLLNDPSVLISLSVLVGTALTVAVTRVVGAVVELAVSVFERPGIER